MDRILQNARATLSETWYEDGEAVDPGTVTVTVTAPDGSTIQSGAAAGTGADARTFTLSEDETASLGVLTATWASDIGTRQSSVEVVGGFYFAIAEFKAAYSTDTEVQDHLSAAAIANARAAAEEIIEGLDTEGGTHQAFVRRAETFELHGTCLEIPRYHVRTIESLVIDGDDVDADGLELDGRRIVGLRWNGPVTVTVTHGWDAPPQRIKDAAILLAYHRAVKGPIDDRATGRVTPEGSVLTLTTPGVRGAVTGIPEVDATIAQYFKRRLKPTSVGIAGGPVDNFGSGWREGVWP